MASLEHLNYSEYIKSVHKKLREDSQILGVNEAWQKHCENKDNLDKYASAMQNLAINHWEINNKTNSKASSRVEWACQFIQSYFFENEIATHRLKEVEIGEKIGLEVSSFATPKTPIKLLDVGSCYNPFKTYNFMEVLPIDIAPATSDVYKCDFLNVKLVPHSSVQNSEIEELQLEFFDVVIFSLVLEYLPSPRQRHSCCDKAYKLLKFEGILIVITPDSKHVGANAKFMKSWRFVLAKMGFRRIKYEKLAYLHCMVFRKSLKKEIAERWASLQDSAQFFSEILIPQDFSKKEATLVCKLEEGCDVGLFEQLPHEFFDDK